MLIIKCLTRANDPGLSEGFLKTGLTIPVKYCACNKCKILQREQAIIKRNDLKTWKCFEFPLSTILSTANQKTLIFTSLNSNDSNWTFYIWTTFGLLKRWFRIFFLTYTIKWRLYLPYFSIIVLKPPLIKFLRTDLE